MKKFKYLIIIFTFMLFIPIVNAGSFSVSSSSTSVSVGDTVTVYVKANDAAGYFSASSNNSSVLAFSDSASSVWIDDSSSSFKFTAKSAGTAVITITPKDCAGYDEVEITGSKTITIKVNGSSSNSGTGSSTTQATVKSSNNYLSSLSIDGVDLSPNFDKDTTEYTVTLPSGTTSVNVNATKENSSAYVNGVGSVSVSEGVNYITVTVTAENGAKKYYNIQAIVLEENPIVVSVNDSEKTLIRKSESMPSVSDYYVSSNIVIDDVEIPCYVSDITGYTLVALKDSEGTVTLYRYDSDSDSYYDYTEYSFSSIKVSLVETSIIPDGYTLGTIVINNSDVPAYLRDGEYPLIYGVNLETGEENFYSYDSSENTVQKFKVLDSSNDYSKYYPYCIIGLIGLCFFEFIMIIVAVVSKNKKLKNVESNNLDKTENKKSSASKKDDVKDNVNKSDKLLSSNSSDLNNSSYSSNDSVDSVNSAEEGLSHTALISNSVNRVYNNSHNRKEEIKRRKALRKKKIKSNNKNISDDDEMFKF